MGQQGPLIDPHRGTPIHRPDRLTLWFGKAAVLFSFVLLITLFISYLSNPDNLAALTFFPPWIWGCAGLLLSLCAAFCRKRLWLVSLACWVVFIGVFAEEPKSLFRESFVSLDEWDSVPQEKRLIVISLNCAGGNVQAAQEIIPYHPDIILLQESPPKEDLAAFANEMFGDDAGVAYGVDTSIIVNGKIEQLELQKPLNIFMTHARVQLKSRVQIDVATLRLKPPVIDINLFSPDCWRRHKQDRQSRQKQLTQVLDHLNNHAVSQFIILGGDFNVSAADGCLRFCVLLWRTCLSKAAEAGDIRPLTRFLFSELIKYGPVHNLNPYQPSQERQNTLIIGWWYAISSCDNMEIGSDAVHRPRCFGASQIFHRHSVNAGAWKDGYFLSVRTSQRAWMTPGMPPRSVKMILIQKCVPRPTCRNAATGGMKIAKIILSSIIIVLSCKIFQLFLPQNGGILTVFIRKSQAEMSTIRGVF